jgi:diguanylate cyclase (GGDEF)-like protein
MRRFFSNKLETEKLSIIATAIIGLSGTIAYVVVFTYWLDAPEAASVNLKFSIVYLLFLIRALTVSTISTLDRYGTLLFFNVHIGWLLYHYFTVHSGIQLFIPASIIATILINPLDRSKTKYFTILFGISLFMYVEFFTRDAEKLYTFTEDENLILYYSTLILVTVGLSLIAISFTLSFTRLHRNLEQAANIDMLTGIRSRRKLINDLERMLVIRSKAKSNLCVALVDVDHFKSVNDTYGHAMGDEALKVTAIAMQKSIGVHGIVGRVGGEEFCIVLTDSHDSTERLERVRQTIAQQPIYLNKDEFFNITISIGYTDTELSKPAVTSLFSDADKALYMAKKEGRNNIVPFRPSTTT